MIVRPITRDRCDAYIVEHHRHHGRTAGALWRHSLVDAGGTVIGVAVVGRPSARLLDDGLTCEVTRLCTAGAYNACSKLYAAARATAKAMGYERGLTYILEEEGGASLRAAGLRLLWPVRGKTWTCPSRPREDKHPLADKLAYGWGNWP